jgi:UrcA family protein
MTMASAATANTSNVYLDGSSVHIRYRDLDLRSVDGRAELQGRIHEGARLLCSDLNDDSFPGNLRRSECNRVMIASGVDQMNRIVRR